MAMRRQTGAPMLVALVATVAILGAAFGALPVADARRIIVPLNGLSGLSGAVTLMQNVRTKANAPSPSYFFCCLIFYSFIPEPLTPFSFCGGFLGYFSRNGRPQMTQSRCSRHWLMTSLSASASAHSQSQTTVTAGVLLRAPVCRFSSAG